MKITKKKKRRGNLIIFSAMILILMPSVLILANLSGSSIKNAVRNHRLHQDMLIEESFETIIKSDMELFLNNGATITLTRDVLSSPPTLYGPWYLKENEEMDLQAFYDIMKNRVSLYGTLELKSLVFKNKVYDPIVVTSDTSLPYDFTVTNSFEIEIVDKSDRISDYEVDIVAECRLQEVSGNSDITMLNITHFEINRID